MEGGTRGTDHRAEAEGAAGQARGEQRARVASVLK